MSAFYWFGRYYGRPWDDRWHDPNSTATVELLDGPSAEPLSLEQARDHLRLIADVGSPPTHPDDDFLTGYAIPASREYVEQTTGRSLAPQRFKLRLDAFPWPGLCLPFAYSHRHGGHSHGAIALPMAAPLIQIESFTYVNGDGVTVSMFEGVDYVLKSRGEPAAVFPLYGTAWPVAKFIPEAVQITYTAGYGDPGEEGSPSHDATEALPYLAAAGMRLMLGHIYENREEVVVGQRIVSMQLPLGMQAVLQPLILDTGVA